jgi:hypothetical protein
MLMSGLQNLKQGSEEFSKELTDENFIPNPENQTNLFLRK